MFGNLTPPPLPSLNALRAFEAMARAGSATRAAEELRVTHSAVSRQVKALEASLGLRLFDGPRHRLKLTPAGAQLQQGLGEGFDRIAAAVRGVRAHSDQLIVAVHASLSVKWLIPRLPRFAAAHPDVALELIELAPAATHHRDAHAILRIRYGDAPDAADALPIMPTWVGPVTAAAVGGDWRQLPRLVSRTHAAAWSEWQGGAGRALPPAATRSFAHLHVTLEAAAAGMGVAMLPWALVADDVAAGRLVAVDRFVPTGAVVALTTGDGAPPRAMRAFSRWLVTEGAAFPLPDDAC